MHIALKEMSSQSYFNTPVFLLEKGLEEMDVYVVFGNHKRVVILEDRRM